MSLRMCPALLLLGAPIFSAYAAGAPLIVVEDHGGVSALPYYRALNLQPDSSQAAPAAPRPQIPVAPAKRYGEADMLPVHSTQLTPGTVERRVIQAPGLRPVFLIGDDQRSRRWLHERARVLRELGAVGLVVSVDSPAALEALRRLVPKLVLSPASGDDLARRLNLRHYPVLITATGIEQ